MALIVNFVIAIVFMWGAGYALAMMVGWQKRYSAFTRNTIKKVWAKYRTQIIWFITGLAVAMIGMQ